MTKFEAVVEKCKFVAWGKANAKDANSYIVKEGSTMECVLEQIKDSTKGYGKIFTVRVKDSEEPIVITGKTDLNNKLGYGTMAVKPVEVGDELQITYIGRYEAKLGQGYKFEVAVKRNK
jgi:hypothetical protein